MVDTYTRKDVRSELYAAVPGLGFYGTADSIGGDGLSVLDSYALRDSTLGANHYRGNYLYRSGTVGDNPVRKALILIPSTGQLSHSGAPYDDLATLDYEIIGPLHPDELNQCIVRAARKVYWDSQVVLPGEVVDGDMESAGTGAWTAVNATVSKVTTAAFVYSGTQALSILSTSGAGYVECTAFDVFAPPTGSEHYYSSAVLRCTVGTASIQVWDKVNNVQIGDTVTSDQDGFVHLWVDDQMLPTVEQVAVRIVLSATSAQCYLDHLVFYRKDTMRYYAPSWLQEQYQFLKLREAKYHAQTVTQAGPHGGWEDASSRYFDDWIQPHMFTLDPMRLDTNPFAIQLMKRLPQNELWIQAKRPYSDIEPMDTESETTRMPLNQLIAKSKHELALVLRKRYPSDQRWQVLLDEAMKEADAEQTARPETPQQPIRRDYQGRV